MTREEAISSANSISPESLSVDVKSEFCKLWPDVKIGLQLLAKIVPVLAVPIGLVIAGGDAIAAKICK